MPRQPNNHEAKTTINIPPELKERANRLLDAAYCTNLTQFVVQAIAEKCTRLEQQDSG
jgi:predicted transcriptional regulator